jgi:hypothetical protein
MPLPRMISHSTVVNNAAELWNPTAYVTLDVVQRIYKIFPSLSISLFLVREKKKKEIISKSKIGRICFLKKAIVELYETVGR